MNTKTQAGSSDTRIPSAPRSLGKEGRTEWRRLCSQYNFAPGEISLLAEYCASIDMLAALRAALVGQSLTVYSPQAGDVANRLLAEIRMTQAELRKLAELLRFRELAVEDEKETFPALRG